MTAFPDVNPSAPLDRPLLCGRCGFDLRATTGRCPECGRRFDPHHLSDALIPWEQRKQIGRIRAYVRTLRFVSFRPPALIRKMSMPISFRAARHFRRITIVICCALWGLAAWGARHYVLTHPETIPINDWRVKWARLFTSDWSFGFGLAAMLIGVAMVGIIPALFFRRSAAEKPPVRCYAIGIYACVGLLPISIAVACCRAALWMAPPEAPVRFSDAVVDSVSRRVLFVTPIVVGALSFLWLAHVLYLLRAATQKTWPRIVAAMFILPILWMAALVLLPAFAELTVAMVALMVLSHS